MAKPIKPGDINEGYIPPKKERRVPLPGTRQETTPSKPVTPKPEKDDTKK